MTEKQRPQRARHRAALRHTRMLCLAAFLTALSFLLGLLAKTLQGAGPLRFTIEGLPVVLGGMTLGPLYGTLIGVAADLLSCLLAGQAPLPLIAVGAATVGFVPGMLGLILRRRYRPTAVPPRYPLMLLFDGCAHLVGSILLKTAALTEFYGVSAVILWRTPLYIGIIFIESYLLYILLRSATVRRELERLLK